MDCIFVVAPDLGGNAENSSVFSKAIKEARIGFFRITDNQFSGAGKALFDHAANEREDSFGGGAKSSTRGRVRSPENARRARYPCGLGG